MKNDNNFIPYLNKIKEELQKKIKQFSKVQNTEKSQNLSNSQIANQIKKCILPPLQKLISYVGGSSKPVSEKSEKSVLIGKGSEGSKIFKGPQSSSNNSENVPNLNLKYLSSIQQDNQTKDQDAAIDFFDYLVKEYHNRNKRGNQSGDSKDWSDYFGRLIRQYNQKVKYLQKNQICQNILKKLLGNLKSQKSNFDYLMGVQKRNYQVSESAIAKSLRIYILPHAQDLVKILGRVPREKVNELQQIDKPYGWQYFPGGRKQRFGINNLM